MGHKTLLPGYTSLLFPHQISEWTSSEYQISRVRVTASASIKWSSRVGSKMVKCESNMRVYSTKYQYFQCRIPCDYWNSRVRVGSSRLKNSWVESNMRISKYVLGHSLSLTFKPGSLHCTLLTETSRTLGGHHHILFNLLRVRRHDTFWKLYCLLIYY